MDPPLGNYNVVKTIKYALQTCKNHLHNEKIYYRINHLCGKCLKGKVQVLCRKAHFSPAWRMRMLCQQVEMAIVSVFTPGKLAVMQIWTFLVQFSIELIVNQLPSPLARRYLVYLNDRPSRWLSWGPGRRWPKMRIKTWSENTQAGPCEPYSEWGLGGYVFMLFTRRPLEDFKQENDRIQF